MSFFGTLSSFFTSIGGMALGGVAGQMLIPVPGVGAAIGMTIGGAIGGMLGGYLFPDKIETNYAPPPKLNENKIQSSAYGVALPYIAGTHRVAGNVIWMGPVVENYHIDNEHEGDVDYDIHTKTYTASFAVAFCMGQVVGISRLWLNNEIFVDFRDPNGTYYPTAGGVSGEANWDASLGRQTAQYAAYFGSETQTADPTIVAIEGAANTQPYRGVVYIVFTDFNVGEEAGLPNVEAEIVAASAGSSTSDPCQIDLDNIGYGLTMRTSSHPWTLDGNYVLCDYNNHRFIVLNKFTEQVLYTFTVPSCTSGSSKYISGWAINPFNGWLWVCCVASTYPNFYRRDLIYYAPNGSVKYDSTTYQVLIGLDAYSVSGNDFFFEPNVSGRAWESFTTWAEGFTGFPGGLRQIDDTFTTVGPYGYRDFILEGSLSEGISDLTVRDIYFSCDGTYFYSLITGDLGYGSMVQTVKFNPAAFYLRSGTHEGDWRISCPRVAWEVIKQNATSATFPDQWSNGSVYPTTVYSQTIGSSPTGGNTIQLYTNPASQTEYSRTYITETGIALSDVVTDIIEMTPLTASDIDVSALTGITVLGYAVTRQMPARTAIEPLMVGYNMDCGEEDWKIVFKLRGGTSQVDIPTTDLGARMLGDPIVDKLIQVNQQPIEIPTYLTLNYSSKNRDYERASQHSYRADIVNQVPMSIDIPLVFTDTQAKQLVEISHQILYQAMYKYQFRTGMKYIRLSPTDLATVGGKLMRITSVAYQLPILEFTAESEEGGEYTG